MGIETLQSAARAAGFAMATSEEPLTTARREAEEVWLPKASLLAQERAPQAPAAPVEKAQATLGEWVKSVIGATGRAPA